MQLPATTGYVAQALGVSEPRLNDLVRRGRIRPPPRLMLGRRLWDVSDVRQAAKQLNILTPELEDRLRLAADDPQAARP